MDTDSKEKKHESALDDLLEEAEALKRRSRASAGKRNKKPATANVINDIQENLQGISENISGFASFLYTVKEATFGFYERFLAPLWRTIRPLVTWIIRLYGRLWNRLAYRTNKVNGEKTLSRTRAGICVALTIAFIATFTPTYLGSVVRFLTIEPLSDGLLMLVSKHTEEFFLNHSEEIDPLGNIHSVRGCRHRGECTEADAVYFRILPRLSHDIWKLFAHGNPLYVPDHVVAPIAPGVNKCEVTYYGYRVTSSGIARLLRSLEVYPTLLEANCTYLGMQAERKEDGEALPKEAPSKSE
jgi:hypothetical protein